MALRATKRSATILSYSDAMRSVNLRSNPSVSGSLRSRRTTRKGSSAELGFEANLRQRTDVNAPFDSGSLGKRGMFDTGSHAFGNRLADLHRAHVKSKANKTFSRQYGDFEAPSAASTGGPRAAVYKGEMGMSHRRATRMQGASSEFGDVRKHKTSKKHGKARSFLAVSATVAACLALAVLFLYGPAKEYYLQVRELDRLNAEYAAVLEHNEAIREDVDRLSTEAGVEDRARQEFGWVKEGENAVSVSGLPEDESENEFVGNVAPQSVRAPKTWYSELLDPLFGVE